MDVVVRFPQSQDSSVHLQHSKSLLSPCLPTFLSFFLSFLFFLSLFLTLSLSLSLSLFLLHLISFPIFICVLSFIVLFLLFSFIALSTFLSISFLRCFLSCGVVYFSLFLPFPCLFFVVLLIFPNVYFPPSLSSLIVCIPLQPLPVSLFHFLPKFHLSLSIQSYFFFPRPSPLPSLPPSTLFVRQVS